jgi:hypothetical protein
MTPDREHQFWMRLVSNHGRTPSPASCKPVESPWPSSISNVRYVGGDGEELLQGFLSSR